jgi:iron complex outermembrane recepter protein
VGTVVWLRLAIAIGTTLAAFRCFGETPVAVFERTTVTGSHLTQVDLETALPLQIITGEEIERSGATTAAQLLTRVPAILNGNNMANTVRDVTEPGAMSANLRGLGSAYTLVLVNGRRLANYAFHGRSVDLNVIPLAVVDRVEILKDGASAIYGTDAISGVVNFILRSDFRGFDGSGEVAWTEDGGGDSRTLNLTAGAGQLATDRYNVFAALTYQKEQRLRASERDWTRPENRPDGGVMSLLGMTFPANIVDRTGQRILNPTAAAGCAPPTSLPARVFPFLGTPACAYDETYEMDLLPEVERYSAYLRGTWRASAQLDLFAEALFSRHTVDAQQPPAGIHPVATPQFGTPVYPANGPYYPTAFASENNLRGGLLVSYRPLDFGPRTNKTESSAQRYIIGADGQAAGWYYNVAGVYSYNEQENSYGGGWLYIARAIAAVRSGLVNPWGPSGPDGRALLANAVYNGTPQRADGTTTSLNAVASRDLIDLPAGPVAVAVGVDFRHEKLSYTWDPEVMTADSPIGSQLQSVSGDRDVYAIFAEVGVPLARGLSAQLAVRHDNYSDFGGTTNPKIALRWQPVSSLLLRASWGEGFRAPRLYSLNEAVVSTGFVGPKLDPVRCPVTGTMQDCFDGVVMYSGGNPTLRPETSEQWSTGVVWQATRTLAVGVDYWNIEIKDAIGNPDWRVVLANEAAYPSRVIRGPVDPAYPDLPGPIIGIDTSLVNVDGTQTAGFDLSIAWTPGPTPVGAFRVSLQGSYIKEWDTTVDGLIYVPRLGTARNGIPVPRWRSTLTLDWTRGTWGASLSHFYTSGYDDVLPQVDGSSQPIEVKAFSTLDFQVRYAGIERWRLAAGIRNLLDEAPPFSTVNFIGYNKRTGSPLGRTYYLRAGYAWK